MAFSAIFGICLRTETEIYFTCKIDLASALQIRYNVERWIYTNDRIVKARSFLLRLYVRQTYILKTARLPQSLRVSAPRCFFRRQHPLLRGMRSCGFPTWHKGGSFDQMGGNTIRPSDSAGGHSQPPAAHVLHPTDAEARERLPHLSGSCSHEGERFPAPGKEYILWQHRLQKRSPSVS